MKKEEKENIKILKVIYFDSDAAIDYITISDGGKMINEIVNNSQKKDSASLDGNASLSTNIPFLNWFKLKAKIEVDGKKVDENDKIIRSTLTNTILTDYISRANSDDSVEIFDNYIISPIKDSLSYYKMYTPYTLLIKKELNDKISDEIDITKIDKVLEETKGYYEFLASSNKNTEKNNSIIIRFNINSFKNNYKLNNIIGMNLRLYGVKVGDAKIDDFSIENEFNQSEESDITSDEILYGDKNSKNNKYTIYDIVLAGVINNENKN